MEKFGKPLIYIALGLLGIACAYGIYLIVYNMSLQKAIEPVEVPIVRMYEDTEVTPTGLPYVPLRPKTSYIVKVTYNNIYYTFDSYNLYKAIQSKGGDTLKCDYVVFHDNKGPVYMELVVDGIRSSKYYFD